MGEKERIMSDFRVGIVTFISIILLVVGITFAGGDKGLLFQKTLTVKALLYDVGGLKRGSTVTMGGMNVGKVTKVSFVQEKESSLIEVTMEVRSDIGGRIKSDSVPSVRTQGMLGDRYIEISMGTPDSPPLPYGQALKGRESSDFDGTIREARNTLEETTKMLTAINTKQGTMGQLVYDTEFYKKLLNIMTAVNEVVDDFKKHPRKYVKLSIV